MSTISQAPLSTPISDKSGKLDANWMNYFLASSVHLEKATTPKRSISLDKPSESLVYVHETAKISYSYTGKGGCMFNIDGTKLVIPETATEQTINSFVILGA